MFFTLSFLQHHEKFHSGLTRREYKCTKCITQYEDLQVLEAHYKKRHGMELNLPFMCKDCDVSFILEEALIYHQKREHSHEISTYKCDECQTEFFSHGYKTVHDMMYHNLSKSEMILCKYCPEIRQSINEILEHHWTYHEMQKLLYDVS